MTQDKILATIRAAAESDGVIPDAVKVEAMARAIGDVLFDYGINIRQHVYRDAASAALFAIAELENRNG